MKIKKGMEKGLQSIPGIGPALARDLELIGIDRPSCLKGKDPERLYAKLIEKTGVHQDRCVLYTFRCAVYFVNSKNHDPRLLKWWNWSDVNMVKNKK